MDAALGRLHPPNPKMPTPWYDARAVEMKMVALA